MRFIHTADWHLGRILFGVHLTEDQARLLDRLYGLLDETGAQALIIAGDVYDRAVPPPEAVRLLDDFLTRVAEDLKIPVIMIAGNHDGPDRLGFGARILEARGVFVRGPARMDPAVTCLTDEDGPISVYALPYAEPSVIREVLGDETLTDHQSAMAARIERIRKNHPTGHRSLLVAHAFVAGSEESESERPLSVGGSAAVSTDLFKDFDYVALGHLHRSQKTGRDAVRYSGSPMAYSFSECSHDKSVNLVTLGPPGQVRVEPISIAPERRLRIVRGLMDDLLKGPNNGENPEDFIQVILEDETPVLDALGRLREIYPNLLHIERPHLLRRQNPNSPKTDHRTLGDRELFEGFFKEVTGTPLSDEMGRRFSRIVDAVRQNQREAGA